MNATRGFVTWERRYGQGRTHHGVQCLGRWKLLTTRDVQIGQDTPLGAFHSMEHTDRAGHTTGYSVNIIRSFSRHKTYGQGTTHHCVQCQQR